MKKLIFIAGLLFSLAGFAQIPAGYYDSAAGLTGNALKVELHDIISAGFVSTSYDNLWDVYPNTDKKANGKLWDMYSDIPGGTAPYEFTFVTDQCGNYSSEGDCYNREHSVPQSWFGGASPMYSDIFHVVPTDGKVNGQRSDFPFGEVGTVNWTSLNGSKRGTCDFPGYTGTVFEPIDSFKGDFARIYFYMCVRYKDEMSSWTGESFSGGDLSQWTENMLLQWHVLDPVSQKEIDRNNYVHDVQFNRNPFVDNPEWVFSIWGPTADMTESAVQPSIQIFPMPANDAVTIQYIATSEKPQIFLCDLQGRIIEIVESDNAISTAQLDNGYYFLRFVFDNSVVEKPLIIQH